VRDAQLDRRLSIFSARGWLNIGTIVVVVVALVTLFAAYPIINFYLQAKPPFGGFNLGGINSSGQVPDLPGLRVLIDPQTPDNARSKVGLQDGLNYNLVFSDEFNTDGRSFYPGDDPFWEAVDLNYWATGDLEWYSPEAITTKDGKLVITLTEQLNHDLNFQSGMLQSWNKLCFTTGILEVSISLPGSGDIPGYVSVIPI
jgi:beta-glucan synthesis-associated protein KRE6